jgi:hypothetical protein
MSVTIGAPVVARSQMGLLFDQEIGVQIHVPLKAGFEVLIPVIMKRM